MAIYRPTFMQPDGVEIDATAANDFTCVIQGTVAVSYTLTIYRVSDNAVIYTDGETAISPNLYNGDTLTVPVPNTSGMINGVDYKWQIEVFEVASTTSALSEEKRFFARTAPVVTITNLADPVTTRDYTYTGSYSQTEGVSPRYHQWILYDSTGDNILDDTGQIFNANYSYQYDRYLDGQSYQIEFIVENQNGTITSTGKNLFAVEYTFPSITFSVSATNNPDDDSVLLDWGNAKQIPGNASCSETYLADTPFVGTDSVQVDCNIVYDEENQAELNLNNNNTTFIHNNFANDMYLDENNTLSGSGWEINGELFTQTAVDGANTYLKILSFELDSFLLYTQFDASSAPVLVEEYRVYGSENLFVLQPSATPTDNLYVWDDNDVWNDSYFWVDGEDLSTVWWKLAWIHETASTHELVWERSADS